MNNIKKSYLQTASHLIERSEEQEDYIPQKLMIEMKTTNADFTEEVGLAGYAIAKILKLLAKKFEEGEIVNQAIFDSYGNRIGEVKWE